ncbi:MAG: biotin transporter BioY, partial [Fidelibacterota bacterium]
MNINSRSVLIDTVWPGTGLLRETILLAGGTIAVAFLSKIQLPLVPVPITGQTLGVLLAGALLGSKRGAISMIIYLVLGAVGIPVFAGIHPGVAAFLGPTGGYLLGFVPAAFLVGWLSEKGFNKSVLSTIFGMSLGTILIYLTGGLWLARFTGWDQVLKLGVLPFLPGDLLKIFLATILLPT